MLSPENLEAGYVELVNEGVDFEFDRPPEKQPWGTEAVFHDPDGNSIVLQQT